MAQPPMPFPPRAAAPQPMPTGGSPMPPQAGSGLVPLPDMKNFDINSPQAQQVQQVVSQPNPVVGEVLFRRIDFLTPDEVDLLDQAITADNAPVFLKLFPELAIFIQHCSALQSDNVAVPPGQDDTDQGQPTAGPTLPPPVAPASTPSPLRRLPMPGQGQRPY